MMRHDTEGVIFKGHAGDEACVFLLFNCSREETGAIPSGPILTLRQCTAQTFLVFFSPQEVTLQNANAWATLTEKPDDEGGGGDGEREGEEGEEGVDEDDNLWDQFKSLEQQQQEQVWSRPPVYACARDLAQFQPLPTNL